MGWTPKYDSTEISQGIRLLNNNNEVEGMKQSDNFVKLSVSFIVRKNEATAITNELQDLPYGIYHMGTAEDKLTDDEWQEVNSQVPEDILES